MSTEAIALALIVLAVVALAWIRPSLAGRKEGWTFAGTASLLDEGSESADRHRRHIYKRCKAGMSMNKIKANEEWSYLSKYSEKDAKAVCDWGYGELQKNRAPSAEQVSAACKRACTNPSLRRTRPCMNNPKDGGPLKCCEPVGNGKLTNCIKIDDPDLNIDNLQYNCGSKYATCPGDDPKSKTKKYCWWGDQPFNKGKCCTKPWTTDCKPPRSSKGAEAKSDTKTAPKPVEVASAAQAAAPVAESKEVRYEGHCYRFDSSDQTVKKMAAVTGLGKTSTGAWDDAYKRCNQAGTAVGDACQKMCIPAKSQPSPRQFERAWKVPVYDKNTITKAQKPLERHGCVYYQRARRSSDGSWRCPPDAPMDTKMAEQGVGDLERYQCTNHQTCVGHIQTENAGRKELKVKVTFGDNETIDIKAGETREFRGQAKNVNRIDVPQNMKVVLLGSSELGAASDGGVFRIASLELGAGTHGPLVVSKLQAMGA